MSAPYQAFSGSDGRFVVGAANQRLWIRFLDVIGRPEMAEDPRYVDNKDRVAYRDVLAKNSAPTFLTRTANEWVDAFLDAGVPAGPINTYVEAFDNDHARERKAMIEIEHPVEGKFKALGFPVKMSGDGPAVRMPPPLLGEHTAAIVLHLGLGEQYDGARSRRRVRRMTGDGRVTISRDGPVATVWFDRPAARNAMTAAMYEQFTAACRTLAGETALRLVVFRGVGGKAFVAGTDIARFLDFTRAEDGLAYERGDGEPPPSAVRHPGANACGDRRLRRRRRPQHRGGVRPQDRDRRVAASGRRSPRPSATACRCPTTRASSQGSAKSRAKRMLLLGDLLSAEEARDAGFLARLVTPEGLDDAVSEVVGQILANAPLTLAVSKEAIRRLQARDIPGGEDLIRRIYGSADFKAGVAAFTAKTKPDWRGE